MEMRGKYGGAERCMNGGGKRKRDRQCELG